MLGSCMISSGLSSKQEEPEPLQQTVLKIVRKKILTFFPHSCSEGERYLKMMKFVVSPGPNALVTVHGETYVNAYPLDGRNR